VRAPLPRNRDYVILLAGQSVSQFGGSVSNVAFPLLVLALTHSALQAGLVGAADALPLVLLSLYAGALVDRWDRKRVMILCDAMRALVLGSIPLAALLGCLTMAQVYVAALAEASCSVFFATAAAAAIPRIVSKERLTSATAQFQAFSRVATVTAPAVGAFLFQTVGQTIPFLVDALSYIESVASLLLIRTDFQRKDARPRRNIHAEIREGVSWLVGDRLLLLMATLTGGFMLVAGGMPLIIILLAREQHAPTFFIGLVFSIQTLGAIAGAVIAPRVRKRFGFARIVRTIQWVTVPLFFLFALTSNPLEVALVAAGIAFTGPIYNVVTQSYRLAAIPDELQGRVNSAYRLIALGSAPIGVALAGVLLQAVGPRTTAVIDTGALLAMTIVVTVSRAIGDAPPVPKGGTRTE